MPQAFIEMIGDHFLEAARYLREIQDEHPDDFVSVARKLKIGRRKAYSCSNRSTALALASLSPAFAGRCSFAVFYTLAVTGSSGDP